MSTANDYERWTLDEVAQWKGASVSFEDGGKHRRAILTVGDQSRFVVFSASPSDSIRGVYNHVGMVRRELAAMGAVRIEQPKASKPKRERNPGAAQRDLGIGEPAPVRPDPWEALQALAGALIDHPGFYPTITCEQYFAEPCPTPALTNSGIQLLIPTGAAPAKFAHHHPAIGQPPEEQKETASTYLGKLVHRLALGKGADYEISPHERYQSNEAKAWKEAVEKAGRIPVKQAVFDEAEAMAAVVRQRIGAATDGQPYDTEVVMAWQEQTNSGTVWCRAMIDVWCPSLLLALDVKTCDDASDDSLQRKFANGYGVQDAWYRRGVEKLTAEHGRARFRFLFIEKDPPYLARQASATEGFRYAAQLECDRALAIFADCLGRNVWPGYDEVKVPPPSWLVNRWDASAFLEEAA